MLPTQRIATTVKRMAITRIKCSTSIYKRTAATLSAQKIVLPDIPELYEENFLDLLLPPKTSLAFDGQATTTPAAVNPVIVALIENSRRTFTQNGAPAYNSTNSAILDAFNNLSEHTPSSDVAGYLSKSWIEDPELTLRLIWTLRSIPDGKGSKETFYQAFGWLYKNHPRTAISNLHLLVEPVGLPVKNVPGKAHGYWKDLLNIICLATLDGGVSSATFRRIKSTHNRPRKERKIDAKEARANKLTHYHQILVRKLSQPKFRALYIAVARLFSRQLAEDIKILQKMQSMEPDGDPIPLAKQISLAGKWAPTPGASHDRVTNIATAISQLIHASQVISPAPSALNTPISPHVRSVILRSFYQRWVLTELRRICACPEPLMSSHRWSEINYSRVPSICMNNNGDHFYAHDPEGFTKYLVKVESGKKSISGATMLPHQLVAQVLALNANYVRGVKKFKKFLTIPAVVEAKKALAETKIRVIEAQWKTLIQSLREAGTLNNCIAVCDVSGSMGSIYEEYDKKRVSPIFASISLSLVLASLTKPPFDAGFITFSARPEFLRVDLKQSLQEQVNFMNSAKWEMNTDFRAVFIDLLLPLALRHKIKPEDMIKRLFVFSDMQFDGSLEDPCSWETTYDFIENEYRKAGYEVPQIVFWDLNRTTGPKTVEVQSDRKGVAMMNGFSPALLKVFMGEEEAVSEWEAVSTDETSATVVEKEEDEFNPINVMKKALLRKTFDGLVVVD